MHIVITGGAGFIGSHLAEYHLTKGDFVHVVDDLSTGTLENLMPFERDSRLRFDEADIITWQGLDKAIGWADRVYHFAAVVGMHRVLAEPVRVHSVNIAGCERVLRAAVAGGWKAQVLVASSSEVYGSNHKGCLHEDCVLNIPSGARSRWNYAVSKLADEALSLSYARSFGLHVTVVRLFNTIGPRQTGRYGMVVPRFVDQAITGEPITVYGDGSQTRSFCDIRDTVVALDRLMSNPASAGEIVNVGGDREISIRSLAEMIRVRAKSTSSITFLPYAQAYGEAFDDVARRKPSLEKLLRLVEFKHRWQLEDTLDELIGERRCRVIRAAFAGGD